MGASHHDETERKYDVDAATVFPNLAEADGVHAVGKPLEHRLEAVYFDTPDLDLVRSGVTLRCRTGGTDAGWHLKLPAGTDTRTELREPLGGEEAAVPESLVLRVRPLTRGRALQPVATIETRRREYPLHDVGGAVMALVADDSVHAERLGGDREELVWREWEVELVAGTAHLLDVVERRLLEAGATVATIGSKLARVLGELPESAGSTAPPGKEASVERLLAAQLRKHLDRLLEQDAGVRAERTEAVHRVRIAARRLRSVLTTFRPLLDTTVTDPVREELRWLGEEFARARDAQVLRDHLGAVLAAEPPELVVGAVEVRLDEELGAAYVSGREAAVRALDSERYVRLLGSLEQLSTSPPLRSDGDRPARKVMPGLLARDVKRLRRAVRAIEAAAAPTDRDPAFHEARKKAKRLRYAAESAVPVLGKRARSLAADTKKIQEILGIHQDTVVARQRLREYGMQAHLDGQNAFTFGRLHALEQARAEQAEADFERQWRTFRKKQVRRWV
ncbi:CYTH and CHAD domain-containing protein [Terrabacter sp. NPDC080008]|uniref:CYTH and CHAD domain-containing protein n=1 Tax=Terrabacter sp. NPDC080008 TaxID=3155176 RepID=UPI00344C26B5